MQFHSVGKSRVPKMKEGLDCTKVENIKLLKAVTPALKMTDIDRLTLSLAYIF